MFTKYTIALTALLLVGGTSIVSAYEDPESKIGDRYPTLEQVDRTPARNIGSQMGRTQKHMKIASFTNEDPESKIADRYPALEQIDAPTQTASIVRGRPQQNARLDGYVNEDVEDKIGDRYPFLDQSVRLAGNSFAAATRMQAATTGHKTAMRRQAQSNY